MSGEFRLYPAIDLSGGRPVRLLHGDYSQMTVYGDDPVAVARRWRDEGAEFLHVVDLDGAKEGRPVHVDVIAAIVRETGLPVQAGGGVRDPETLETLFSRGVARCVVGTAALENPDWIREILREYGERIVVGLDARDGKVAVRGWLQTTGISAGELGKQLREWGAKRALFTDIRRDGAMAGPNGEAAAALAKETGLMVIASGGVRSVEDIRHLFRLRQQGVAGAVVGRALYTGDLSLAEAIAWLRGQQEEKTGGSDERRRQVTEGSSGGKEAKERC